MYIASVPIRLNLGGQGRLLLVLGGKWLPPLSFRSAVTVIWFPINVIPQGTKLPGDLIALCIKSYSHKYGVRIADTNPLPESYRQIHCPVIWHPCVSNHRAAYLSVRFGQCLSRQFGHRICGYTIWTMYLWLQFRFTRLQEHVESITKSPFVLSVHFATTLQQNCMHVTRYYCIIYHHVSSN